MGSKAHFRGVSEADPWEARAYAREALRSALVELRVAGEVSHDRPNVIWKLRRLCEGDPDLAFGLRGLDGLRFESVLGLMARASGFPPDPELRHGSVSVDPDLVIDSFERIGDRLAEAARRGERVLLATGHPAGLPILYAQTGRLLAARGAKLLRPLEGFTWKEDDRKRQVRYFLGVAALTDRASALHTHSPEPMRRMLEDASPDLVFADHGFAGAAIQAGIETLSIADVNDPALVVAHQQGRAGPVAVMDDNVQPERYWPCFQVIASRFDPRPPA